MERSNASLPRDLSPESIKLEEAHGADPRARRTGLVRRRPARRKEEDPKSGKSPKGKKAPPRSKKKPKKNDGQKDDGQDDGESAS
jgi:hypothetical protein